MAKPPPFGRKRGRRIPALGLAEVGASVGHVSPYISVTGAPGRASTRCRPRRDGACGRKMPAIAQGAERSARAASALPHAALRGPYGTYRGRLAGRCGPLWWASGFGGGGAWVQARLASPGYSCSATLSPGCSPRSGCWPRTRNRSSWLSAHRSLGVCEFRLCARQDPVGVAAGFYQCAACERGHQRRTGRPWGSGLSTPLCGPLDSWRCASTGALGARSLSNNSDHPTLAYTM